MFRIDFNDDFGVKPGTMEFENKDMAIMYANLYYDSIDRVVKDGKEYTAEEFLNEYEDK